MKNSIRFFVSLLVAVIAGCQQARAQTLLESTPSMTVPLEAMRPTTESSAWIPGRLYLCWGDARFTTWGGKPIPAEEIGLMVLVLRTVTPEQLIFSTEDKVYTYVLPRNVPKKERPVLHIYPIIDDTEVQALRKRYEGKTVYFLPGATITGYTWNIEWDVEYTVRSATIKRLVRIQGDSSSALLTGGASIDTKNPLIALLLPRELPRYKDMGDGLAKIAGPDVITWLSSHEFPTTYYRYYRNAWDLAFSVKLPK